VVSIGFDIAKNRGFDADFDNPNNTNVISHEMSMSAMYFHTLSGYFYIKFSY